MKNDGTKDVTIVILGSTRHYSLCVAPGQGMTFSQSRDGADRGRILNKCIVFRFRGFSSKNKGRCGGSGPIETAKSQLLLDPKDGSRTQAQAVPGVLKVYP